MYIFRGKTADGGRYRYEFLQIGGSPIPGNNGRSKSWADFRATGVANLQLWPEQGFTPHLMERAVSEGQSSDALFGENPAAWSPLGRPSFAAYERWREDEVRWSMIDEGNGDEPSVEFDFEPRSTGEPMIRLLMGTKIVGAMVLASSSFIVPVRQGTTDLEIEYYPEPEDELIRIRQDLERALPWADIAETLVWRLYIGSDTSIVDGMSSTRDGRHHIGLKMLEGLGTLVATVVLSAN